MSTVRATTTTHAGSAQVHTELSDATALHLPTDLSDSAALAIASWWQGPTGSAATFATFASTGTADADDLLAAIADARVIASRDTFVAEELAELDALEAWVIANADPDDTGPTFPEYGD